MKFNPDKLKEYRISHKFTQKDLAEGICSQAMVSKIEKNDLVPDINTVLQFADKLGVDIKALIGEESQSQSELSTNEISELLEKREYFDLEQLLQKSGILNKDLKSLTPMEIWLRAIVLYLNYGEKDQAISMLTDLKKSEIKDYNQRVRISNTLASFLLDSSRYIEAEAILNELQKESVDFSSIDTEIASNYFYTTSLVKINLGKNLEAKDNAQRAINNNLSANSNVHLEEFYSLLASVYYYLGDFSNAFKYNEYAYMFAEIKNSHLMMELTRRNRKEIEQAMAEDENKEAK